jgi:hypothetical protein
MTDSDAFDRAAGLWFSLHGTDDDWPAARQSSYIPRCDGSVVVELRNPVSRWLATVEVSVDGVAKIVEEPEP